MPDDSSYMRNPAVNATEIDDETFLVDPETGEVFYLDEVTSALWRLLETPVRSAEIVETFEAAFPDVPEDRIAADLEKAIDELLRWGLAVRM